MVPGTQQFKLATRLIKSLKKFSLQKKSQGFQTMQQVDISYNLLDNAMTTELPRRVRTS